MREGEPHRPAPDDSATLINDGPSNVTAAKPQLKDMLYLLRMPLIWFEHVPIACPNRWI